MKSVLVLAMPCFSFSAFYSATAAPKKEKAEIKSEKGQSAARFPR
jgi:hypothetical protein